MRRIALALAAGPRLRRFPRRSRNLDKCAARHRVWALVLLCAVACASPTNTTRNTPVTGEEPPPRFAPGGPDAEAFGANMGYPKGTPANYWRARWRVGSNSHLDEIFRGRLIHKASTPSRLVRVAEPHITFRGADLDQYLSRYPTTGLLIARGETILVERYQYGRTDRHRLTSWPMAKTVAAMLIGIAKHEGRIRSVDDLAADYVPELDGTEYGRTSLRHLLQMSSGVRFNEELRAGFISEDLMQYILDTFMRVGPGGVGAVTSFSDRERPAGTKFSYSSVDALVLGLVLTRAIGGSVAEYLEQKVWQPIGAEADATLAHRQLGPRSYLVLPERGAARLRSPWATAGSRRQLARPSDHPGHVGAGGNRRTHGPTTSLARHGHGNRGLRLPDMDHSQRTQDVHALGCTGAADLRRPSEQTRHGEHRRTRGLRSPCAPGDERALVCASASAWWLAGSTP
jgi:CubicO group peptidase (beta-lactamase class C family)